MAGADSQMPSLPWKELKFEASRSGLRVETTMRLRSLAADQAQLTEYPNFDGIEAPGQGVVQFSINTRTARARGDTTVWLDSSDLRALQHRRYTQGRGSRVIEHRYGQQAMLRERREPDFLSYAGPEDWPLSSAVQIDYPADISAPILAPESLFLLAASPALSRLGDSIEAVVAADRQLYRVRLQVTSLVALSREYKIRDADGQRTIRGPISALRVDLQAQLIDADPEQEPFELFELGGPLSLFIDAERGLPLQIRSKDSRTGSISIHLRSARL